MRRMMVEFVPDPRWVPDLIEMYWRLDQIESFNVLEVFEVDTEGCRRVVKAEYVFSKSVGKWDGYPTPKTDVMATLKRGDHSAIVIAEVFLPQEWRELVKRHQLELVWDVAVPRTYSNMVATVLGAERELGRLLEALAGVGKVVSVSYKEEPVCRRGVLGNLSRRQREVLLAAKAEGYYDYPRRVRSEDLARKMGIKKSTLIEHLRRAENRLIQEVLAEY